MPRPSKVGSPLDGHVEVAHGGELDGVVVAGEDGLGQVDAHLGGVHVEGGDELDVAHVVAAQLDVHQPGHRVVGDRRPGSTPRPGPSELAQFPTPAIATRTVLIEPLPPSVSAPSSPCSMLAVPRPLQIVPRVRPTLGRSGRAVGRPGPARPRSAGRARRCRARWTRWCAPPATGRRCRAVSRWPPRPPGPRPGAGPAGPAGARAAAGGPGAAGSGRRPGAD